MNYKRIGRALICLVLVCALLVNVSPIKAEAVAVESALGIGLAACLILASCGMIYTGLTQSEIIGVGNAFSTYMYQWGTSAEQLDEVDAFFGGVTLLQGPSGGDGDDDDDDDWSDFRFTIPKALQRAIAGFTAGAIAAGSLNVENKLTADEGYMYYGDELLPDIELLMTMRNCDSYFAFFHGNESVVYVDVFNFTGTSYYRSDGIFAYSMSRLFRYKFGGADWTFFKSMGSGTVMVGETNCGTGTKPIASNLTFCDDTGSFIFGESEPSSTSTITVPVLPDAYVSDIPQQVQNGTITEENLTIPDTIDYSSIAAANPDLSAGVMDYLGQVANGTVTYEDMMSTIVPEAVPEPEPEPEPDPEPSEETFPAIVPDAGQDTVGNTNANTFLQEITDIVTTPFKWIWTNLDTKLDTLKPPEFDFDKLTSIVTEPAKWIWGNIESFFAPLFDSTWTYIQAIPDKIAETAADIGAKLQTIPDAIAQGATQVKTAVEEAVEKAVVPEKDYLTSKVNALREEFVFADSIVRTGEALQLGLAGISTTPPVIYIHLEDTEGSYNIGGTVPFLDLRWYARYKPTVDTLISAFLWICFVWRMLVKLPGIISGMPGDFVMASAHQMGVTDYLPTRSKEYEIQRISNRETIRKGPGK